MAKKKSKAKKKTARDPEQTRRAMVGVAMTAAAVVVLAGGALGLTKVNAAAANAMSTETLSIEIEWPQIEATPGSTWLPASEKARLLGLAELAARGGSPLSAEPLAEISRALQAEGWFTGEPSVRRGASGLIRVEGAWRIPAAVIRTGNRERLVSWEGVPLPLEYSSGASRVRYLAEPSVPSIAPGFAPDAPWPGSDIADGLALLDVLDDDPALIAQVHGLDLNSGSHIEIVTDRGTRVRWGLGPKRFQPGERTTGEKLTRLRYLLEQTGRIDGNAKLIEIDGPQVLIVND